MPVDRRTPIFYGLILNQLLFTLLLGTDYLFDLRTEFTLSLPVSYWLTIGYILTSGLAPAFLAAFYIEHLLDNAERHDRILVEHTIGLSVLFAMASAVTWYWLSFEPLEFFPVVGLVIYLLASGVLWLAHVGLLMQSLARKHTRKKVTP